MKNLNWIFALVALAGGLTLYIMDKEILAATFATFVWAVYAQYTKTIEVKKRDEKIQELENDFKEAVGTDIHSYKNNRK